MIDVETSARVERLMLAVLSNVDPANQRHCRDAMALARALEPLLTDAPVAAAPLQLADRTT